VDIYRTGIDLVWGRMLSLEFAMHCFALALIDFALPWIESDLMECCIGFDSAWMLDGSCKEVVSIMCAVLCGSYKGC
jgi:hypothetical protein